MCFKDAKLSIIAFWFGKLSIKCGMFSSFSFLLRFVCVLLRLCVLSNLALNVKCDIFMPRLFVI